MKNAQRNKKSLKEWLKKQTELSKKQKFVLKKNYYKGCKS